MYPDEAEPHLRLLGELITAITDAATEPDIFGAVARHLPEMLPADRASVALPTPDDRHLEICGLHGPEINLPPSWVAPIEGTMVGRAYRQNQAWMWPTATDSPLLDVTILARAGIREFMNAPLVTRNGPIGVLNVSSVHAGIYQEKHLALLRHIARLVATCVDQRRLHEQALRASEHSAIRAGRLEVVNGIAEELSACLSDAQAHQALLAGVSRLVPGALRASVVRFDETLTRFRVIAFSGLDAVPPGWQPVRGAAFGRLIATGAPVAWVNLPTGRDAEDCPLSRAGLRHSLSIPMTKLGRIVGAVNLSLDHLPPDRDELMGMLGTLGKLGGATLDRLAAQAESDATLGALIDGSPVLLLAVDSAGLINRVSRLGAVALGYEADLLVGTPFAALHPDHTDAARRASCWAQLPEGAVNVQEVRMSTRDGRQIWARQSARVVRSATAGPLVLVACEDVTSLRELTDTLRHQARHDPLTGLPNRRSFEQSLLDALPTAGRVTAGFALLFVDLDRFKAVNDRYGHGIGDALLCRVAERISAELPAHDVVSRIGGDEFQVLLHRIEHVDEAVVRANSVRKALAGGFELDGQHVDSGCSIGISVFPTHGADPDQLIQRADTALRQAKRLGRNTVRVYRP